MREKKIEWRGMEECKTKGKNIGLNRRKIEEEKEGEREMEREKVKERERDRERKIERERDRERQ